MINNIGVRFIQTAITTTTVMMMMIIKVMIVMMMVMVVVMMMMMMSLGSLERDQLRQVWWLSTCRRADDDDDDDGERGSYLKAEVSQATSVFFERQDFFFPMVACLCHYWSIFPCNDWPSFVTSRSHLGMLLPQIRVVCIVDCFQLLRWYDKVSGRRSGKGITIFWGEKIEPRFGTKDVHSHHIHLRNYS